MDLSSLVFVAIIGVWAAYLVPHWLSRREDLAQSRTPDRFSGGLRVLQRRSRKPRPDRSVHRSGDAVLTSPRVVVDADGEYLYIPADRALEARTQREAVAEQIAVAAAAEVAVDVDVDVDMDADVDVDMDADVDVDVDVPEKAPTLSASAPSTPEAEMPERPSDLEIAIGAARIAARRRAMIMVLLFVATVTSWVISGTTSASAWVGIPATMLLVMHVLASRVAGLRSRETLMLLAVQVRSADLVQARPQQQYAARPADVPATAAPAGDLDRVARRAAAVGAETWEPIPVPPPTYTLKPAVHRPEPAPLERPAAAQGGGAAVSRGALPRRAADIERILALESDLDELFEEPKVVNG